MTHIQALDIIHQVRMKYECNGESGDLIREAFRVLKELVDAQKPTPPIPGDSSGNSALVPAK